MHATTKHGKMMTYREGLFPLKSHDPLISCSSETTWQTKTSISSLPQCLSIQKSSGVPFQNLDILLDGNGYTEEK